MAGLAVWLLAFRSELLPAAVLPDSSSGTNVATAAQLARGKLLYFQHCVICHQSGGQGSPGIFPPLAQSDFLANKKRTILALVQGLDGPIQVNGKSTMAPCPRRHSMIRKWPTC